MSNKDEFESSADKAMSATSPMSRADKAINDS